MSLLALLATKTTDPEAPDPGPAPVVDPWEGKETTRLHFTSTGDSTGGTYAFTSTRPKGSWRIRHTAMLPAQNLRLRTTNNIRVTDPGTLFRQAVSVELDDGTIIPATYSGEHLVTIDGGTSVETDTIVLPRPLAAGERFWVRTYRETDGGGTVPSSGGVKAARGESANLGSGGADITLSGAFPAPLSYDYSGAPHPHTFTADTPVGGRAWAIAGSSSSEAASDDHSDPDILYGSPGYFGRAAMRDQVGTLRLSRGATSASDLLNPVVQTRWFADGAVFDVLTDLMYGMGRNDISSGSAFPQALAQRVIDFGLWARSKGLSGHLWMSTIQPHTKSTDGWTTVEGQSPQYTEDGARVRFNAWIRDRMPLTGTSADEAGAIRWDDPAHPFTGMVDYADAVETARDSNRWKPGYTKDGLHCTPDGYKAVTAIIPNLTTA